MSSTDEFGPMKIGESKVFDFPVPDQWGGGVSVAVLATCECGGILVPGRGPRELVCANRRWYRRDHARVAISARVVKIERGFP